MRTVIEKWERDLIGEETCKANCNSPAGRKLQIKTNKQTNETEIYQTLKNIELITPSASGWGYGEVFTYCWWSVDHCRWSKQQAGDTWSN